MLGGICFTHRLNVHVRADTVTGLVSELLNGAIHFMLDQKNAEGLAYYF